MSINNIIRAKDFQPENLLLDVHEITHTRDENAGWINHITPRIILREYTQIKVKELIMFRTPEKWQMKMGIQLSASRIVDRRPNYMTLHVTDSESIRALMLFQPARMSIEVIDSTQILLGLHLLSTQYWNAHRSEYIEKDSGIIPISTMITPIIYPKLTCDGSIQWVLFQAMLKDMDTSPLPTLPPFDPKVPVWKFPPFPVCPPPPPPPPPPPCIGMVKDATLLTDVCAITYEDLTLDTAYRTQCKHLYDRKTIQMWWKTNVKKECPYCKAIEPACPCISCK